MEKLEMWDYIVAALFILAVWMHFYGIRLCREAENFDEKKLRNKVYGAIAVSVIYLLCRAAQM